MARHPETAQRELRVREILRITGAVLTDDHFVYTSGLHGSAYVNKDAVYPHPLLTQELCGMIAADFRDHSIDTVIGPALGGIILAHNTAAALSQLTHRETFGVFAEKTRELDGGPLFELRRGFAEFVRASRVLVVEDLLTTGGSAGRVVELCRSLEAEVIAVAVLANRGRVSSQAVGGAPINALLNIDLDSWPEEDCELCQAGIPVNILVGKGSDFLRRKGLMQ